MKRNRLLIILTVLVVIIGILFLINRKYTTLDNAESGFAIEDTASITKIFLVDMNNRSVKLTKERPGKWTLNDEFLAQNFNVTMLVKTMKDIKVRYPVPLAARDNVIRRLATIAIKVEIYQSSHRINLFDKLRLFPYEKLAQTYYVGDATPDNRGTYMKIEGAEQPYVVFLPSLRGFLYPRYSTDEDDWRDQTIFRTPIQDFASVKMEFMQNPQESFIVEADRQGNLSMKMLSDNMKVSFDTLRMLQFVSAFKDIRYESVLNNKLEASYIDSIASGKVAHVITLREQDGDEFVVRTYRKGGFGEIFDEDGATMVPFDLDRLYAFINNDRDFVLIQYFVFDKVVRNASYLKNLE
jgi:hypothetical protein